MRGVRRAAGAAGLLLVGVLTGLAAAVSHELWWSLPLTAGYLVAIPFAVLTASPSLGRWFKKVGLAGIPEDFDPPPEIRTVQEAA